MPASRTQISNVPFPIRLTVIFAVIPLHYLKRSFKICYAQQSLFVIYSRGKKNTELAIIIHQRGEQLADGKLREFNGRRDQRNNAK